MGTHPARRGRLTSTLIILALMTLGAPALADHTSWAPAQSIEAAPGSSPELNSSRNDGCPIMAPDGLSLYMASNRPRFEGDPRTDLDIWVASRASTSEPFGAPVNLGAPVNSDANDFCPTPVRGNGLFFVSTRAGAGSCGMGDIYFTRRNPARGWTTPTHLPCDPVGPNSHLDEQGPSHVEVDGTSLLYFSRSSSSVPGDIFVSTGQDDGFGPAAPVVELNDTAANDIQPNVRKDGREVVFSSNRTGTLGLQDIWIATRASTDDPWSQPVNLGANVNTPDASESRPSFSWDARTLLFGRAPGPEGGSDIYVTTRE